MSTTTKTRPLGRRQHSVLRALIRHGYWHPGAGWVWKNTSDTTAILESLVRRGLVERHPGNGRYEPTREGQLYATGSYVI